MGDAEVHEITPIPLSALTTIATGGAPERMIDATTTEGLVAALRQDPVPYAYAGRTSSMPVQWALLDITCEG